MLGAAIGGAEGDDGGVFSPGERHAGLRNRAQFAGVGFIVGSDFRRRDALEPPAFLHVARGLPRHGGRGQSGQESRQFRKLHPGPVAIGQVLAKGGERAGQRIGKVGGRVGQGAEALERIVAAKIEGDDAFGVKPGFQRHCPGVGDDPMDRLAEFHQGGQPVAPAGFGGKRQNARAIGAVNQHRLATAHGRSGAFHAVEEGEAHEIRPVANGAPVTVCRGLCL